MKMVLSSVCFCVLILASSIPTALTAATAVDETLTNSCMAEINKKREEFGKGGEFPVLTKSTETNLSIQDTDIKAKFCTGSSAAAEAISANVLFYAEKAATKVSSCATAIREWEKSGLAAIKDGNPVAYKSSSPGSFYQNILNIGFAGMLFGKHVVTSGTGKVRCATIDCTSTPSQRQGAETPAKEFSVICELTTSPNTIIKANSQIWSEAEYKLISGVEEITGFSFVAAAIGIWAASSL